VDILEKLNIHLVTLANNHIMDYGISGLKDTLLLCKNKSINYVGAGMSLEESQKTFIFEKEGIKVVLFNFAENEWANSEKNKPGANPLDIINNVRQIKQAKTNSNIIIVVIHGGNEYYHLPSPRMVKQYRFYAENGATVIIGHHQHCISGYEVYNGVPIFYSLGNFLFTIPSSFNSWYTGLILKLKISRDRKIEFSLHPIRQDHDTFAVKLLKGKEEENILKDIYEFNKIISDEEKLEKNWNDFIEQRYKEYINIFNPFSFIGNHYIRGGFFKLGCNRLFMSKNKYKQILNMIRCESHYDVLQGVIKKYIERK
jgi:poly-gamma-glutamate synthesis protein (capsule biosynthesis protein)